LRHGVARVLRDVELEAQALGLGVVLSAVFEELVERGDAGPADRLVGADGEGLERERLVKRLQRERERNAGAVRVRDELRRLSDFAVVHSGDHERTFGSARYVLLLSMTR